MRDLGTKHKICSYYLSKAAVSDAEIICVPYVSLLDENMRKNLGIEIEKSVIIIDEAHNLLEAIN